METASANQRYCYARTRDFQKGAFVKADPGSGMGNGRLMASKDNAVRVCRVLGGWVRESRWRRERCQDHASFVTRVYRRLTVERK